MGWFSAELGDLRMGASSFKAPPIRESKSLPLCCHNQALRGVTGLHWVVPTASKIDLLGSPLVQPHYAKP
jgi:hypothetical protein